MATDKKSKHGDNYYLSLGISFGLLLGVGISISMDNWGLIGAGLAIGIAIGVALDAAKKDEKPKPEEPGDESPGGAPKPGINS